MTIFKKKDNVNDKIIPKSVIYFQTTFQELHSKKNCDTEVLNAEVLYCLKILSPLINLGLITVKFKPFENESDMIMRSKQQSFRIILNKQLIFFRVYNSLLNKNNKHDHILLAENGLYKFIYKPIVYKIMVDELKKRKGETHKNKCKRIYESSKSSGRFKKS